MAVCLLCKHSAHTLAKTQVLIAVAATSLSTYHYNLDLQIHIVHYLHFAPTAFKYAHS